MTLHTKHNIVNRIDTPQRTKTVYDMLERPTSKVVDLNGNGADENDSGDAVTRYTYDKVGNVLQEIDPEGKTVNRLYDGANRLVRETVVIDGSNDLVTEYQYDANGNKTKIIVHNETGSGNQETVMTYDALNRLTSTTDPEGNTESYQYDLAGNKTVAIDKRGFRTDFYYDNARRLVKTVMPQVLNGETSSNVRPQTTQVYDKNGNVTQATDARGLVTNNVYDVLNRLTQKTVKAESDIVTTYTYDDNNNKLSETLQRDDANLTTAYTYDSFNRPFITIDPEGFQEICVYDTVGNKTFIDDKRGNTTNMTYDLMNRLTSTMLPAVDCYTDGNGSAERLRPTTQSVYLKNGLVSQVIDANGNILRNFYDAAGRKIRTLSADGGEVLYAYDKTNNVLHETVKDSIGAGDQITDFTYNKLNKQLTESLETGTALQRVYAYSYDASGNKASRTFPDGTVTNYSYNALNKLIAETYAGAEAQNRSYEYNLAGTATKATDNSGITQYTYDKLGRILSETKKTSGGTLVSTITSTYDKAGNRLIVTYPGGRQLVSTYDKRNALKTITDGVSVTTYDYDGNGNRVNLALPNGINTETTFDEANRVVSIAETTDNRTEIYKALYYYDKTAARLKIVESRNGVIVRNSIFTYDTTDKLLSENDGTTNIVYTYDNADNRISKTVNGVETTYQIDKLNRVLSSTTDGTVDATYTYDTNGNRSSKTVGGITHNYTYDRENRLTSVKDASNTQIFSAVYDYRTRRISCIENNVETRYIYDSGECAQERDSTGSLTKQFIKGTGLGGGIGSILYTEKPAQEREYLLYNVIGSVVVTCDNSASVKSTNLYEAFGKIVASTGTSDNNRLFCTKERSASIGLDNFGFRYFDWDIGRFIQRDPAGYPDGLNNYLYCSNNPINRIDPLGLSSNMFTNELIPKKPEKQIEEAKAAEANYQETKKEVVDTYQTQRDGGASVVGAVTNTALVQGLKATGVTQGVEAVSGTSLTTGENLGGWERVGKGVEALINGTLSVAAGKSMFGTFTAKMEAKMAVAQEKGEVKGAAAELGNNIKKPVPAVTPETPNITTPVGELRASGMKDAHHIIQDAAVRDIPGYNTNAAPGVQLLGPSTSSGTPHNLATAVQRQAGGGNYAAERRIGYKALRNSGITKYNARQAIEECDTYFNQLGVNPSTPTRIPGNR